jgi:hypothetical protein
LKQFINVFFENKIKIKNNNNNNNKPAYRRSPVYDHIKDVIEEV